MSPSTAGSRSSSPPFPPRTPKADRLVPDDLDALELELIVNDETDVDVVFEVLDFLEETDTADDAPLPRRSLESMFTIVNLQDVPLMLVSIHSMNYELNSMMTINVE